MVVAAVLEKMVSGACLVGVVGLASDSVTAAACGGRWVYRQKYTLSLNTLAREV